MRFYLGPLALAGILFATSDAAAQAPPAAPPAVEPAASASPLADLEAIATKYNLGEIAKQILSENIRRLRRATVLGPQLGVNGLYRAKESEVDGAISGGLALGFFSVPTTFEAPLQLIEQLKQRAAERIKQRVLAGQTPSLDEAKQIALQVFHETKEELLGRVPRQGSTFERPIGGVSFELARVLSAGDTQLRLTPSFGISYVNVGLVAGVTLGRHDGLLGGLDLSLRLMPGEGPRANMYEPFLRGESMITRSNGETVVIHTVASGLRVTFDLL